MLGETKFEDLEKNEIVVSRVKVNIASPESLLKLKKNTLRQVDVSDSLFLNEYISKKSKDN